jgi:hypothetical protein
MVKACRASRIPAACALTQIFDILLAKKPRVPRRTQNFFLQHRPFCAKDWGKIWAEGEPGRCASFIHSHQAVPDRGPAEARTINLQPPCLAPVTSALPNPVRLRPLTRGRSPQTARGMSAVRRHRVRAHPGPLKVRSGPPLIAKGLPHTRRGAGENNRPPSDSQAAALVRGAPSAPRKLRSVPDPPGLSRKGMPSHDPKPAPFGLAPAREYGLASRAPRV